MNPEDAQANTLIKTKFSPPRLTRVPVHREAALGRLADGLHRPLTLIKAPAGFGKTTLLTTWREILLAQKCRVAWLTLDQDDNDDARFAEYLGGALASILSDNGLELSRLSKLVSAKVQLTSIINLLDHFGEDLTLILDDYDKIVAPEVHRLLGFLLHHIPANLHIVIACRADPPLELACLRARDQLVEVTTELMRFRIEDTQAFFAGAMPDRLSADETRAIHDATEGWVAGLQIATLALPGQGAGVRSLISALPRHSRALSEYLVENVLHRLPDELADFMLRSAGPDRLNASLCRHLTGAPDAAEKLEWLVRHNMFLQPIDEDGQWYRYHALFADFLRSQLRRRLPDQVSELDVLAAQWFSEQERWAEAVRHALDAGRVDLAAEWLERCALAELQSSRVRNFLGWIQKLPDEALRQRPRLRVAHIWALILTIQTDQAQALLNEVSAQLDLLGSADAAQLRRILHAQGVSIRSLQDRLQQAIPAAHDVWRERFPDGDRPLYGFDWEDEAFLNCMIHFHRKEGNLAEAWRVSEFYQPATEVAHNPYMQSYRACLIAMLEVHDGQTRAGAQRLEEALEVCEHLGGRRSSAATLIAATLAEIYYAWNRLDAVEDLLADRFDVIDDVCFLEPTRAAYLSLARVRTIQGSIEAAHALLIKAETLAGRRGWPRLQAACICERIHLWLLEGQPSDADRALKKLASVVADAHRIGCQDAELGNMLLRAQARAWLYNGHAGQARDVLIEALRAKPSDSTPDLPQDIAQLRLLLAVAHHACGEAASAFARLNEVMALVDHEGTIRLLADEGPAVLPVLHAARASNALLSRTKESAGLLAQLLGTPTSAAHTPSETPAAAATHDDTELSRREVDILELISQKLSNKQVAKLLFITPETVKWHLKNIYRKLGVSDRRLAAHKGRLLPQLPTSTGAAVPKPIGTHPGWVTDRSHLV